MTNRRCNYVVRLAAVGMALVPMLAGAGPIYLECTTYNEHSSTTTNYKITLDETAHTATFTDDGFARGETITRPAQFSQAEVTFGYSILGLLVTYRIDRVSLEFSASYATKKTDRGTCKMSTPVERAF